MHSGCIKCPENTLRGCKCGLVAVSRLDATSGTLKFRGTPVEKQKQWPMIMHLHGYLIFMG